MILVGDLNYRVNGCLGSVIAAINRNMYDDLLFNDQLIFEFKTGRVTGFQEGRILFAPTYKRAPGTNDKVSVKRNPSWTDRILFNHNADTCELVQKSYESNNLITLSDHRPVFSQFLLKFKRNEDKINFEQMGGVKTKACSLF